jgi:hypothetical protein
VECNPTSVRGRRVTRYLLLGAVCQYMILTQATFILLYIVLVFMRAKKTYHGPIERYSQYGDTRRPSASNLRNMIGRIERSGSSATLCTLASMFVDLAVAEPETAGASINGARQALSDVIENVSIVASKSDGSAPYRAGGHAVTAHLTLAGLQNWELAATRQVVTNSYETLLEHSVIASCHTGGLRARARLAESIPHLLGLRRLVRTEGEAGWYGRLALYREDARGAFTNGPRQNKSWDVGAALGDGPEAFMQPDVRMQVKLGSIKNGASYRRGGVVPVSARSHGFDDPGLVIISCANELDGYSGLNSLTTSELDAMTDKLARTANIAA